MEREYNLDRMMGIDPTIDSVLDNCARVSRKRGEWVDAEIFQKAADEIRKRNEKISYLLGVLSILEEEQK